MAHWGPLVLLRTPVRDYTVPRCLPEGDSPPVGPLPVRYLAAAGSFMFSVRRYRPVVV